MKLWSGEITFMTKYSHMSFHIYDQLQAATTTSTSFFSLCDFSSLLAQLF